MAVETAYSNRWMHSSIASQKRSNWSLVVTMKQFAVHSLGWGAGLTAFLQLPALASSPVLAAVLPDVQSGEQLSNQVREQVNSEAGVPEISSPQLIAESLAARSLSLGDQGQDVRILQRFLRDEGLYPYLVDGVYGSDTANSVAAYQDIRGLSVTGNANESTLIDMGFDFLPDDRFSTPSVSDNTAQRGGSLLAGSLAPGATGTDVIALQQRLNAYRIPVFVDGVYGFETEQAVRTYQRVRGLPVTGTADSETLDSMGFSVPNYPYISAIIADESRLGEVQQFFPNAYVDRNRRGRFINIGSFGDRFPAEARVDAATARGFTARVLYRRSGFLFGQ